MTYPSSRVQPLDRFFLGGALFALLATLAFAQTSTSTRTGAGDLVLRGQTEPAAKCEIPAALRGILAEVNVKEGQAVKKGQPLAKLDDALQRQKVEYERIGAESTKEIEYAQSQAAFARQDYEATKRALGNQGMEVLQKESTLQTAELAVGVAQDKQKQNQSRYQEEQIILEHMTLRSPIDGSVLRVNKQVGEQTDDNPVLVVVQTSKLIAIFYPPKDLFGKIAYGDKVPLDLEGAKCEGVVVAVDPIIDPASQIFRVKLEVDNKDGKLAAGVNAAWTWTKK